MFGPSIAVALGGVALLGGRGMSLSDPWTALGLGFAVGGGGWCLVLLLLYWRWRLMTFPVRHDDGVVRRLTRDDLRAIMTTDYPALKYLEEHNPGLGEWFMMADFPPLMLRNVTQFWRQRQR